MVDQSEMRYRRLFESAKLTKKEFKEASKAIC